MPRFPFFAVKILDPLTDIATSSLSPSKPVFDVPKFIAGADAVPVPTDNPELVDKSTKPDCTFVKAMFDINFYFYLYEILTLYIFIIHSRMYLMVFAYFLR